MIKNNEIIFHLGPRRCGKSEFVEAELSPLDNKVYIATLPNASEFQEIINEHRKRRGVNWITIELSFNFDNDIKEIDNIISKLPDDSAVLLDGIYTWFCFSFQKSVNQLSCEYFADQIALLILKHKKKWRLIDVLYYNLESDKDYEMFYIQQRIIKKAGIDKIVNWNYERI